MTKEVFVCTVRVIPWHAPLIAVAVVILLVVSGAGDNSVFPLQAGAILLGGAIGFALDDPAFELLGASPTSLLRRRTHRIIVILPLMVCFWAGTAAIVGSESFDSTLTLVAMLTGTLGLSLGFSGVIGRLNGGRGGPFTAPAVLLTLIVSGIFPPALRPLPLGDIPGGWTTRQIRWGTAALIGVLALLASSRDPAKRRSCHTAGNASQ